MSAYDWLAPEFGLDADRFYDLVQMYGKPVRWYKAYPVTTGGQSDFSVDRLNTLQAEGGYLYVEQTLDAVSSYVVAPPAVSGEAGGALAAGAYRYKVALGNNLGQTLPSAASDSVTVAAGGRVQLTGIETGPWGAVQRRHIYRTRANGTTFYQVGVLEDNELTTWTDTVPDAALGDRPATEPQLIGKAVFQGLPLRWSLADGALVKEGDASIGCMARDYPNAMLLQRPDRVVLIANQVPAQERIQRGNGASDALTELFPVQVTSVLRGQDETSYIPGVDYEFARSADLARGSITWLPGRGPAAGEYYVVDFEYNPRMYWAGVRRQEAQRDGYGLWLPLRGLLTLQGPGSAGTG